MDVMSDSTREGYYQAINILQHVFGMAYNEPIEEIYDQQDKNLIVIQRNDEKEKTKLIECFPNPTSNLINLRYKLPDNCNMASINIYDNIGKLIKSIPIEMTQGIESFNMNKFSGGLYYYTLIVNTTTIASGKFIVNK